MISAHDERLNKSMHVVIIVISSCFNKNICPGIQAIWIFQFNPLSTKLFRDVYHVLWRVYIQWKYVDF